MPPLTVPVAIPNYRVDAQAMAFKAPRRFTAQPTGMTAVAGNIGNRKLMAVTDRDIYVCVRNATQDIVRSTNRGASWGVSRSVSGIGVAICLEPVWNTSGATPGMDVILGIAGGLQRFQYFGAVWSIIAAGTGPTWNDIAVADPLTRGMSAFLPAYTVTAQTMIAVGAVGGVSQVLRSTDSGVTWVNVGAPALAATSLSAVCKGNNFWIASCITGAPDIGTIFKSTDDGATWTAFTGVQVTPQAYGYDPASGFMLGINGNKIYESGNGLVWNLVYEWVPEGIGATNSNIIGVRFDGAVWILATNRGSILLSNDRRVWREIVIPELNYDFTTAGGSNMRTSVEVMALNYENFGNGGPTRSNCLTYLARDSQGVTGVPELFTGDGVLDYLS